MAETSSYGLTRERAQTLLEEGDLQVAHALEALGRRGHFMRRPSIHGIDLELAHGAIRRTLGELSLEELDQRGEE